MLLEGARVQYGNCSVVYLAENLCNPQRQMQPFLFGKVHLVEMDVDDRSVPKLRSPIAQMLQKEADLVLMIPAFESCNRIHVHNVHLFAESITNLPRHVVYELGLFDVVDNKDADHAKKVISNAAPPSFGSLPLNSILPPIPVTISRQVESPMPEPPRPLIPS